MFVYVCYIISLLFFFFKQKTAYEMRISDWSSDVCSSDLNYGRKGCGEMQAKAPGVAALTLRLRPRQCTFLARKVRPSIFRGDIREIGRASCRERVCQYV